MADKKPSHVEVEYRCGGCDAIHDVTFTSTSEVGVVAGLMFIKTIVSDGVEEMHIFDASSGTREEKTGYYIGLMLRAEIEGAI